jgi:hypothetical protein
MGIRKNKRAQIKLSGVKMLRIFNEIEYAELCDRFFNKINKEGEPCIIKSTDFL